MAIATCEAVLFVQAAWARSDPAERAGSATGSSLGSKPPEAGCTGNAPAIALANKLALYRLERSGRWPATSRRGRSMRLPPNLF